MLRVIRFWQSRSENGKKSEFSGAKPGDVEEARNYVKMWNISAYLTTMPSAAYRIEAGSDGGALLYRFLPLPAKRPLIRRPTGALAVPLAGSAR